LKKKIKYGHKTTPPIPNHESINKAACARAVGVSRPYVSRIMRGLDNNPAVLAKVKTWIHSLSSLAALL